MKAISFVHFKRLIYTIKLHAVKLVLGNTQLFGK